MKVLLFTHKQDIDGMGCAVLAKEAFTDLKIVPCKTFEITDRVSEYVGMELLEILILFLLLICVLRNLYYQLLITMKS